MAGVRTRAQRRKQADIELTAASPLHELSATTTGKVTRTKTTRTTKKAASEEVFDPLAQSFGDDDRIGENPCLLRHHTGPVPISTSRRPAGTRNVAQTPGPPLPERIPSTAVNQFFTESLASCSDDDLILGSRLRGRLRRGPREPHSLIHIWVDPSMLLLKAARPRCNPTIAASFPSSNLRAMLKVLASVKSQQQSSTGLTPSIVPQVTLPSPSKRKLSNGADMPQPSSKMRIEANSNRARKTKSGICETVAQRDGITPVKRQRRPMGSTPATFRYTSKGKTPDRPRPQHHYNEKGELILEATTEAPGPDYLLDIAKPRKPAQRSAKGDRSPGRSSSEESSTAMVLYDTSRETSVDPPPDHVTNDRPTGPEPPAEPATPSRFRWGLGSILNSAHTVTRFFPSLGRSRPILAPVAPATIATSRVAPKQDLGSSKVNVGKSPVRNAESNEKSRHDGGKDTILTAGDNLTSSNGDKVTRSTSPSSQVRRNETRNTSPIRVESHKSHENINLENVASKDKDVPTRIESPSKNHRQADQSDTQSAGSKRKRTPNLKTIPNPLGAYGMADGFFDDSSSDEDPDDNREPFAPATPTPKGSGPLTDSRLRKKPRIESRAPPLTSRANFSSSAIAAVSNPNDRGHLDPSNPHVRILDGHIRIDANFTGMVNPAQPNSFKVPGWDTDESLIDDDDDDMTLTPSAQTTNAASPVHASRGGAEIPATTNVFAAANALAATSNNRPEIDDNNSISNGVSANKSSPSKQSNTWSQSPPPPPHPSHATLPTAGGVGDSERLSAVRAKALQHAPQKPSKLRESSRIVSSPASQPVNEIDNSRSKVVQSTAGGRKPLGEASSSSINVQASPQGHHVSSKSVSSSVGI